MNSADLSEQAVATMTGADALLCGLVEAGVNTCFANPGTTELDLVRALERRPDIRCIIGLQENVCTGAADGFGRMTGCPATTLLHLGPGLANGIANLHNARRARTPIINLVGDQASWHLHADAPLTSDIESLARPVSGWVHRLTGAAESRSVGREAVRRSLDAGGQGVTLILPADHQAAAVTPGLGDPRGAAAEASQGDGRSAPEQDIATLVGRLKASPRTVFLLGGGGAESALSTRGQRAVARLCAALGATAFAETFPSRAERGQGLPAFDRLPYFPEPARQVLDPATLVVLVGAQAPVTYFGYEGQPSFMVEPERLLTFSLPGEPVVSRIEALADALSAPAWVAAPHELPPLEQGPLTPAIIANALARQLPDDTIVSVEGGTCGYAFYAMSAASRPHTTMTNTGGAIGQGLPLALGAAIACPDRKVVALLSDGSTQYTIQTLWSLAHEQVDVIVLIAANHQYAILRNELRRGGASLGEKAAAMTSLADPCIDWVGLASAYGVSAARAATTDDLTRLLGQAFARRGPMLIEMAL